MDQIRVQPVKPTDADALARLRVDAMRPSLEAVGRFDPKRARERFLSSFQVNNTWKVCIGNELAGFYSYRIEGSLLHLDHLYIRSEFQQRGIARKIVDDLKLIAIDKRCSIRLMALVQSPANLFYKHMGFILSEQLEYDNIYHWKPYEKLEIRSATMDEFESVMHLMRQLNADDPDSIIDECAVYKRILDNSALTLLVADNGSGIIGSCYLNVIPNLTRGGRSYAVIENVITDIGHRQRGVGRRLIDHASAIAWNAGCYKIMLLSGRSTESVRAFYNSCGFDSDAKQAYVMRAPS